MTDDLKDRGPSDRTRINVHEPHELHYWSKALDVTEEQLRAAVAQVGVMVDAVRVHLDR